MLALEIAGETLRLHGERALYWPARRTLLVADVHLGKGAALRRGGIALPSGASGDDLARLARLVEHYGAERLLVLGDLFHAPLVAGEPLYAAFDAFRAAHAALELVSIRGNHDRGWRRLPADWRIAWIAEALREPPFVFMHEPGADERLYRLAGHVHPAVRLKTGSDRVRLPVFCFGPRDGLLPAFGGLTGHHDLVRAPGIRFYAAAGTQVLPLQR